MLMLQTNRRSSLVANKKTLRQIPPWLWQKVWNCTCKVRSCTTGQTREYFRRWWILEIFFRGGFSELWRKSSLNFGKSNSDIFENHETPHNESWLFRWFAQLLPDSKSRQLHARIKREFPLWGFARRSSGRSRNYICPCSNSDANRILVKYKNLSWATRA